VNFKELREIKFLNVGVFNLGFIGVSRSNESARFLEWWNMRLMEYCYVNTGKGQFVDQIWLNFAPVFFEKVFVLKDPGLNIAYWNYKERSSFLENNFKQHQLNGDIVFVHFSARVNLKVLAVLDKYLDNYESSLDRMDSKLKSEGLLF